MVITKVMLKVNDHVMAKWPGSSLWFEGKIVDLNDIEYQVRFNDETESEYVIRHKDVKLYSTFYKSRSRSRSRGRSAARAKKAVEKEKKVVVEEQEEVQIVNAEPEERISRRRSISPAPAPPIKSFSPPIPTPSKILSSAPSARPPLVDTLISRTSTSTRQSLLFSSTLDVTKNYTKNSVDGQVNNVNAIKEKTPVPSEEVAPAGIKARLCGGVSCIGSCIKSGVLMFIPSFATVKVTPVIVLLLALPLVLNRMCTKNKCTVMEVPDIPTKLEYYYDLKAIGIVAGLLFVQLILGLIPLGKKVNLPNGAVVRCNGFLSVLVCLILIPSLMYFEYNVLLAYRLYQHFLATVTILSIIIALLLYIRARRIPNDAKNPAGNTGSFLPDLFWGRELNPVIGNVDVKFFLCRAMSIMTLMLNIIVVVKDLEVNKGQYSPTLLVACTLQIFSAVDLLWFEDSLSTTYEYKRCGCGLLSASTVLQMPFFMVINSRIVLNHRTELEWVFLSLIAALNLIGYTIFRGSLSQKHAFRTNPSDPALAHLESLPTSAGTRLLVSSWWGIVRHPNYLGEIITVISWGLLCGFNLALPWILVGLCALFLVARIFEVENACKRKYGTAWDSYTERVKYRLIPKVF